MSKQEIGEILASRRKALDITQPNLAQLAGVGINTLYKIERGQANPSFDTITKIADVLGMEIKVQVKKIKI